MRNLIEVKNIYKTYPGFELKNVSFHVPGGCIMGLVGENGAGKSTTIKAILDLLRVERGSIKVLGMDSRKEGAAIREDVGVVIDGAGFHESLTAKEIQKYMCKIYKNWDDDYYFELLKKFSVPENKKIKDFSTGMKRKLFIAAAIAHHPRLLILDEATSGLDPVVRDEILDILLGFIQDEEHSVLISSHITSDLEKVADYITFIHKGEIFLSDEKDRIMENYGIVRCNPEDVDKIPKEYIVGIDKSSYRCDVLVCNRMGIQEAYPEFVMDRIRLEDILLFKVKYDR